MNLNYLFASGGLLSVLASPLLHHYLRSRRELKSKRRQKIIDWKYMVNHVHNVYPTSHFKNWDEYALLSSFLTDAQRKQVLDLKLEDKQTARVVNKSLGSQDQDFMAVIQMLKEEINRVEIYVWKLI
jgi:hypothetical protein